MNTDPQHGFLTIINVGSLPGVPVGVRRGPGDDACLQGRRLGEQVLQATVRQQGQRFLTLLLHLTQHYM